MPVMKYKDAFQKTFQKEVFGVRDLVNCSVPEKYAKKRLHELAKQKKIRHIERGRYTLSDDIISIATHITEPCYLSLWSAMSVRGLTTQIPFTVEVITTRKRFNRRIKFNNTNIVFYKINPKMMFGYENIIWEGSVKIPVARKEKIVIDGLYFNKIPKDELKEIVDASDSELLREYAKLTRKKKIIKKVEEMIRDADFK